MRISSLASNIAVLAVGATIVGCELPIVIPEFDEVPPDIHLEALALVAGHGSVCVDTRVEESVRCENESPEVRHVVTDEIQSDSYIIFAGGHDDGGVSSLFICARNGAFSLISENAHPFSNLPSENCFGRIGNLSEPTDSLHAAAKLDRIAADEDVLIRVDVTDFHGNANSVFLQLVPPQ